MLRNVINIKRSKIIIYLLIFLCNYGVIFPEVTENIVITGIPANIQIIQEAAEDIIKQKHLFGSSFEFYIDALQDFKPLSVGDSREISLPYFIKNNNKENRHEIKLNVKNQNIKLLKDKYLVVSNEPEDIKKPGLLIGGYIQNEEPLRLMYYHKNNYKKGLIVALIVENRNQRSVKMHFIKGSGGPGKDGLYVGHVAARRFMSNLQRKQGRVLDIKPLQKRIINIQTMDQDDVVSGVFKLAVYGESRLEFKLIAADRETLSFAEYLETNQAKNPRRISGFFENPYMTIVKNIDLDGDLSYYRIGEEPFVVDYRTGRPLRGNYGLFYTYKLRFTNNNNTAKKLKVYFAPNGGVARGVFLINNSLKEAEVLNTGSDNAISLLTEEVFGGGESRIIEIMTFPQAGSNYPVSLLFKAE